MNAQYSTGTMQISVRPARQDEDDFLFEVYASTRAAELALLNWPPEQKEAFLRMQSRAQLQHYRLNYPRAEYQIIETAGQPLGRLIIDRSKNPILLMDIALLPAHQGQGFGTALIQGILAEAAGKNWSVRLHVEAFNPAMRLYNRLGFSKDGTMGIYHQMTWSSTVSTPLSNNKATKAARKPARTA
jgi:GNAT superfamily N-acetyltransferase